MPSADSATRTRQRTRAQLKRVISGDISNTIYADKMGLIIDRKERQKLKCKAISKRSGERCKNWAMIGRLNCRLHGGKSTGRGNKKQ